MATSERSPACARKSQHPRDINVGHQDEEMQHGRLYFPFTPRWRHRRWRWRSRIQGKRVDCGSHTWQWNIFSKVWWDSGKSHSALYHSLKQTRKTGQTKKELIFRMPLNMHDPSSWGLLNQRDLSCENNTILLACEETSVSLKSSPWPRGPPMLDKQWLKNWNTVMLSAGSLRTMKTTVLARCMEDFGQENVFFWVKNSCLGALLHGA